MRKTPRPGDLCVRMNNNNNLKARVFISCGQRKGSPEEKIALEIYEKLRALGYDPWLAIEEQTLKGLKENIFPHLDSSEYFLFIDFKREKIVPGNIRSTGRRGSLFLIKNWLSLHS